MYRLGKDYDRMDRAVYGILLDYGIASFPVDIVSLARRMGINVLPYSALDERRFEILISSPKTETGFLVVEKKGGSIAYTICYNDRSQDEGRWRITIGHEIKHVVFRDPERPSPIEEELADYFGKQINAPRAYLIHKGLSGPSEIMKATGLSSEATSYLVQSLQRRRERFGDAILPIESEYIEFVKEVEAEGM